MKKTIKALIERIQQNVDGNLNGGFASIKGGASLTFAAQAVTNGTCSGTNKTGCTNNDDCSKSTNSAPGKCTNSNVCYIE